MSFAGGVLNETCKSNKEIGEPLLEQGSTEILQGQAIALYAFDVGYEVLLEKLSALFASMPVQPLSQKKKTPSFLQYARPPHVLNLGTSEALFGRPGQVQATIFDFGAVSIAYRWQLTTGEDGLALEQLPRHSQDFYSRNLLSDASRRIEQLLKRIEPAVVRPNLSSMIEDYYLFIIERLNRPLTADELLTRYGSTLAQALRFEAAPLSDQQRREALSQKISYYESDLLLVDWNAALIYDQDYEDTAKVLELLNVELLEARFIDFQLDRLIQEYARLAHSHKEWPIPLRTPLRQAIREITDLRMESAVLAERVGNALKLVGDLYLARVHTAAAERFYLKDWENIISHKLNVIDRFYQLLIGRLRTMQNQTLELAIIALILLEILLAIF